MLERTGGTRSEGLGVLAVVAALLVGSAVAAAAQETSLTIYQDGRVAVRRTIPVALPRGTSTVSLDLGGRGDARVPSARAVVG